MFAPLLNAAPNNAVFLSGAAFFTLPKPGINGGFWVAHAVRWWFVYAMKWSIYSSKSGGVAKVEFRPKKAVTYTPATNRPAFVRHVSKVAAREISARTTQKH